MKEMIRNILINELNAFSAASEKWARAHESERQIVEMALEQFDDNIDAAITNNQQFITTSIEWAHLIANPETPPLSQKYKNSYYGNIGLS